MEKHVRMAGILAQLLDNQFEVAGIRFGLDPIIGLIPGLGDAIAMVLSLYIVWVGAMVGLPTREVRHLLFNVVWDFLVGLLPVFGDVFDIYYKANMRNMSIMYDYLKSREE